MWLPDCPDTCVWEARPRTRQCGSDLCGMMSIIIEEADPTYFTAQFKAATCTREISEGLCCFFTGKTQQTNDCQNGQCIAHVMLARYLQGDFDRCGSFARHICDRHKVIATAFIWFDLARLHPVRCINRHIALHSIRDNV